MEILYFFDRTLTEVLQYFSRFTKKWFRIGPRLLSWIIFLLLAVNLPFLLNNPDLTIFTLGLGIVLYFGNSYAESFLGFQLLDLQIFLDPKFRRRKIEFGPNHFAWSSIMLGVSYVLLGYRLPYEMFQLALIVDGCFLFSHGLWHFFTRPRMDLSGGKDDLSEILQRLSEARTCSAFTPIDNLEGGKFGKDGSSNGV